APQRANRGRRRARGSHPRVRRRSVHRPGRDGQRCHRWPQGAGRRAMSEPKRLSASVVASTIGSTRAAARTDKFELVSNNLALLLGHIHALEAENEAKDAALTEAVDALFFAEASLADIGDADREPGDDVAWCERRAQEELPRTRKALATCRAALEVGR